MNTRFAEVLGYSEEELLAELDSLDRPPCTYTHPSPYTTPTRLIPLSLPQCRRTCTDRARSRQLGDPFSPATAQGPQVDRDQFEKIMSYITLAKEEGGTILCGGKDVNPGGDHAGGYFIEPTVIEGLSQQCRTNQEEIFGPVVTIQPFDREEEALALANASDYGLASVIWSNDIKRCHRVARALHAGIVWVNCWMIRDLRTSASEGHGPEGV